MQESLAAIDADAHVLESEHTWDYLEPEEEKYRPLLFKSESAPGREYWVVDGQVAGFRFPSLTERELAEHIQRTGRNVVTGGGARDMDDVKLRVKHLDALGIDYQVLYNTLWIAQITDRPEVDVALCRSWNRWMADVWKEADRRLLWTSVVPTSDLEAAIELMLFAKQNGAVGICLRPFEGSVTLTDEHFYPLYHAAVELELAVTVHIANGSRELSHVLRPRYVDGGSWEQFRVPAVMTAFQLITSHIHEQFPSLQWGIIEASATWMSWIAHELRARTGKEFSPESNVFKDNNIFVTCQTDDDIPYLVKTLGPDSLVIGTDYGHTDPSSDIDSILALREKTDISEDTKERILSLNPPRLYGLTPKAGV